MEKIFFISVMILFFVGFTSALPVFPGAEGFGTDTRAAYGAANTPEICIVDSLLTTTGNPSWDASNYPIGIFKGTLIQCLEGLDTLNGETIDGHVVLPNSGKIILFEVSGTIRQEAAADADNTFRYKIGSYTTIAGQTSPEPGILFRNICIFGGGVNDVLIQHLRGRMDGPPSTNYNLHRSFAFATGTTNSVYNIVLDHISSAWGADGQVDLYHGGSGEFKNITVSNSILSESRENMGLTDEETNNGKNILFSGHGSYADNFLLYGNLLSNSKKRNPRIVQAGAAVVNNYMYNNADFTVQLVADNDKITLSLVGNVVDAGPMSTGVTTINQMVNCGFYPWQTPISQNKVYLYDTKTEVGTQANSSDWSMVQVNALANPTLYADAPDYPNVKITGETPSTDAPLWPAGLTLMPSNEVKNYIIANAGAYPAFRDSLDTRFINEMITGTGPSNTVQGAPSAGDWPVLATNVITLDIPNNPHADDDSDGYTNLEEWIHGFSCDVEGPQSPSCLAAPLTCQSQNYSCCDSCESNPQPLYDGDCPGVCCGVCATSSCGLADTDTDGFVNIAEVINYITQWKAGNVNIADLINGITEWKNGCS